MLINPIKYNNFSNKRSFKAEPQDSSAQTSVAQTDVPAQEIAPVQTPVTDIQSVPTKAQSSPAVIPAVANPVPSPIQVPINSPATPQQPEQKRSLFKKSVDFFRSLCKFNVAASSYTGGVVKGFVDGALAGAAMMAVAWTLSSAARVGRKEEKMTTILSTPFKLFGSAMSYLGVRLWNLPNASIKDIAKYVVKTPYRMAVAVKNNKNISTAGKTATFAAFGALFGYNIFKSVLKANDRKAGVDHKFVNTTVLTKG